MTAAGCRPTAGILQWEAHPWGGSLQSTPPERCDGITDGPLMVCKCILAWLPRPWSYAKLLYLSNSMSTQPAGKWWTKQLPVLRFYKDQGCVATLINNQWVDSAQPPITFQVLLQVSTHVRHVEGHQCYGITALLSSSLIPLWGAGMGQFSQNRKLFNCFIFLSNCKYGNGVLVGLLQFASMLWLSSLSKNGRSSWLKQFHIACPVPLDIFWPLTTPKSYFRDVCIIPT